MLRKIRKVKEALFYISSSIYFLFTNYWTNGYCVCVVVCFRYSSKNSQMHVMRNGFGMLTLEVWALSNIVFRQIFTHSLKQAVWQYAKEKCLMPEIIYILRIIQGDEPKDLKDISRNFWIDHHVLVFLLTFRKLASISILNY